MSVRKCFSSIKLITMAMRPRGEDKEIRVLFEFIQHFMYFILKLLSCIVGNTLHRGSSHSCLISAEIESIGGKKMNQAVPHVTML